MELLQEHLTYTLVVSLGGTDLESVFNHLEGHVKGMLQSNQ